MMAINYFQYRCYSDHPYLKSLGGALYERFKASKRGRLTDAESKKYRRAFISAISGLVQGGAFNHLDYAVHIPLNKNHYFGKTKRSSIFGLEAYHALKWMISDGYLEEVVSEQKLADGTWAPRGYRLTRKYLGLAVHHSPDVSHADLMSSIGRNGSAKRVELRVNKRSVKLRPGNEKDLTLKRLAAYDRLLKQHKFAVESQVLAPFVFSLTRIYTNDYEHGGRYYSLFQQTPSSTRLNLLIDGEPTAEVDYKGLHPSLLYQRAGIEAPQDPYTIAGDPYPRSMVKKAFQVLINRSKPAPAHSSLVFWLNRHRRTGIPDPVDWQGRVKEVNKGLCVELERTLYEHFKPISHYFCKGIGLELQHYDSQLVSHVLDYFLVKTESVVIPIHDSFLVKQSDLPHLAEALRYAEVVQARASGLVVRSPDLEVEAAYVTESYDSYLSALGDIKNTGSKFSANGLLSSLELSPFSNKFYDQYLEDVQEEDEDEA